MAASQQCVSRSARPSTDSGSTKIRATVPSAENACGWFAATMAPVMLSPNSGAEGSRRRKSPSSAMVTWIAWWACWPVVALVSPIQRLPPCQTTICPLDVARILERFPPQWMAMVDRPAPDREGEQHAPRGFGFRRVGHGRGTGVGPELPCRSPAAARGLRQVNVASGTEWETGPQARKEARDAEPFVGAVLAHPRRRRPD